MTFNNRHLMHPSYRSDIDGLRAAAVLMVVMYHAFPSLLKGGFIGVDIFFVISGFLISTIIFKSLQSGNFSFIEFYSRRVRRIFPALITVLCACLAIGWLTLLGDEYKQLGKHTVGGAFFVPNILYWRESGYFDNSADTKPLLHLWSLGIEEQFYLLWPLLLWATRKIKLGWLSITLGAALVSFLLNLYGIHVDRVATFYLPQTRFWELLVGALLAYAYLKPARVTDRLGNLISWIGLLAIMLGVFFVTKERFFPGAWALLPTVGAACLIAAGSKPWLNRSLLAHPAMVWIGRISFPLYLWHWPLLSFARILESDTPSPYLRISLILTSVVLAWGTYTFIEKPLRFGKHSNAKTAFLLLVMAVVAAGGSLVYLKDGVTLRNQDREEFIRYFNASFPDWRYFKTMNIVHEWRSECGYFDAKKYLAEGSLQGGVTDSKPVEKLDSSCYRRNDSSQKVAMIWGDSHAQALSPGLRRAMPANWQILQVASSGCTPNPDRMRPSITSQCDQSNYFAIKTMKEARPDVVVVAQADGHSIKHFMDIAKELKSIGIKKIVFVGPTPHWTSDLPKIIARQLWFNKPRRTHVGVDQAQIKNDAALKNEFSGDNFAIYLSAVDVFCNDEGCLTYVGDNLKTSITTWDYGHLTLAASEYLARHLLVDKIVGEK